MQKKFYITAAIPYVNAPPHIGHALEFIQVDVVARYHKLLGDKVTALTGGDENALKNVQAAEKAGVPTQEFVDKNAQLFLDLTKKLNTPFDVFQKGTSPSHFKSSQELWNLCLKKGDIYKKNYEGLYCVGCETFYPEDELNEKGECFEHPGKKLDKVSEVNYFFKLSFYQKQLIYLISNDKLKIYPEFRKNEVLSFLKEPLHDISISRSNKRAKNWGVPVPNDPTQRMYVWFDALNIYRSGVDEKTWPADLHIIGKGIIRFHTIYWPAFLLSAGLDLPKAVMAHGYLTVDGQKMSKSLGNVVNPFDLIKKYGVDAVRYYLLREIPSADDGNYSEKRMNEVYSSDLANELGNLVMRITTLAEKDRLEIVSTSHYSLATSHLFDNFQFNLILENIWRNIKILNKQTDDFAPWKKTSQERKEFLTKSLNEINQVGFELQPFLPETAEKILKATTGKIRKILPLFPRL
ncbi:Methionine--tRNA ligase [Candidatus Roizmanbacteria bacterium]|nr:Methionine--tRNA ligase [Candidatus Roizmanbacteria bacterium]